MGEHVAAVGDLEREVDVLLDQQDGTLLFLGEAADDGQQRLDDHRGEPEAELVEQHQPRRARERPCDREHLLLAAREQPGAPALQLSQLREVLVPGGFVELLPARADAEVLGHGQPEEEAAALRHMRDAESRAAARRCAREVGAVEHDAAGHRLDEPGDGAQDRRLAGAVRAEQRDDLARRDRQIDAPDHRRLVVARGQPLERENGVSHARPRAASGASLAAALPR